MYNKLKTKPFLHKNINQKITPEILENVLKDAYQNTRFSTVPYHFFGLNSKQSIKKYKEGNCVALSMYMKYYLKKKGFKSFLIPSTIPYFIQHPDLLEISHVALAIPKNKNNTFIVDISFYFIKALHIIHNKNTNKSFHIMNFTNNELEEISSNNKIYKQGKTYNNYQKLPKNTQYVNCFNKNKEKIFWNYILREIVNPDKAISSFFLKVKKDPFFLSTDYKNNRCFMKTSMNLYNDNKYIVIKNNNNELYSGNIDEIPEQKKYLLESVLKKYRK
tara:strand:- start:1056 stop:1880 length:825 start_codon:yes stop_codon:yes gene_type:complete